MAASIHAFPRDGPRGKIAISDICFDDAGAERYVVTAGYVFYEPLHVYALHNGNNAIRFLYELFHHRSSWGTVEDLLFLPGSHTILICDIRGRKVHLVNVKTRTYECSLAIDEIPRPRSLAVAVYNTDSFILAVGEEHGMQIALYRCLHYVDKTSTTTSTQLVAVLKPAIFGVSKVKHAHDVLRVIVNKMRFTADGKRLCVAGYVRPFLSSSSRTFEPAWQTFDVRPLKKIKECGSLRRANIENVQCATWDFVEAEGGLLFVHFGSVKHHHIQGTFCNDDDDDAMNCNKNQVVLRIPPLIPEMYMASRVFLYEHTIATLCDGKICVFPMPDVVEMKRFLKNTMLRFVWMAAVYRSMTVWKT